MILHTRAEDLDLSRPRLMGVLNVTPDSFSDGGRFLSPQAAVARAEELAEEGADIIDVGGESTRPGAAPVPLEEELARVVPVVEVLAQRFPSLPLSVDTTKAEVARRCLEEGASIVNDISALRFNDKMADVIREHEIPVVMMHMQGDPRTMQKDPVYRDVVGEIKDFFKERIAFARSKGIKPENILLDPGIGFGKTVKHNLEILRNLKFFADLGYPLVVGASRKSFVGKILAANLSPSPLAGEGRGEGGNSVSIDEIAPLPPDQRLEGTLAVHLWAAAQGAHILRVHDIKETWKALSLFKLFNEKNR